MLRVHFCSKKRDGEPIAAFGLANVAKGDENDFFVA